MGNIPYKTEVLVVDDGGSGRREEIKVEVKLV